MRIIVVSHKMTKMIIDIRNKTSLCMDGKALHCCGQRGLIIFVVTVIHKIEGEYPVIFAKKTLHIALYSGIYQRTRLRSVEIVKVVASS